MTPKPTLRRRQKERGQTILLVAISLVTLLGMTALAIDVVTLYVSRAEAQRAADAAALAGAKMLVDTGLTTDPCNSTLASAAQTLAMNQAMLVAAQNNVSGQAPTATVTFPNGTGTTSCPNSFGINPQVKVVVQRTGLPTFFSRIWGSALGSVSASAVAEGYNPSGSAGLNTTGSVIPISPRCTKPIILPNCDPGHLAQSWRPIPVRRRYAHIYRRHHRRHQQPRPVPHRRHWGVFPDGRHPATTGVGVRPHTSGKRLRAPTFADPAGRRPILPSGSLGRSIAPVSQLREWHVRLSAGY